MYDIYVLSFIIIIVIHHNHCYMSLSLSQITFIQDIKKKNNALHTTFFQTNNKTKIINTKASNEDFLKYSILLSLHYYDITYHPERISKIKPFENKYKFSYNTPNDFEKDNPIISLRVYDENNEIIYTSNNNNIIKANIVKINNHRYAAKKPIKNKAIKLNEFIQSHSHHELRDHLFEIILKRINNIDTIGEEIISKPLFY